uniref:Uncharacterized protein n=1 Tax=Anopheles atroparvus TaxID=41427 RepID=A0AAG5DIG9_ANOAO
MGSVVENSSFVDGEDDADDACDDIDNGRETTNAEDEEEVTSNGSGHEEVKREKDDVDGRGKPEHEEAEDGKKDVDGRETTKHEEAEDGKKDGDGRENTSGSADQDGQTKKSKKGMGKKLKMCIGALQPFVPTLLKTTFKIAGYFEASNEASNQNDGKRKAGKTISTTPNDEDQKISSGSVAKLQMANKRLQKQLEKYRDEHTELKTRIRELSEVESQLIAARSLNVKLKEDLHESQSSRENLIAKMSTQSEEQRFEVNRLDAELRKVTKDLAKLEQDKQSIQDKDRKNVESLQIMKQDLETMTSLRDKLNLDLIKQEESHRSETSRLTEKLESVEKEKNELTVQHREQLTEAEMEIWRLKEEIKELEYEAARLKSITGTIEANPSTSATVERGTGIFPCPVCGEKFANLPDRSLHAKGCLRYKKYF